ncbi:MAG: hypothetical protein ACON4W_06425 [Parvibaculales bacterium]
MKKLVTICAISLLTLPAMAQDAENEALGRSDAFGGNEAAISSDSDNGLGGETFTNDEAFGGGDLPPVVEAGPMDGPMGDPMGDIAPLEDVISGMSEAEFSQFEQGIEMEGGFSDDVGFALDQASISQALEAGVITQEQADTVGQLVELVEANSESFDFDLEQMITEELTSGDLGGDEALRILQTFNTLSDADKAIAGSADFDPARDYEQLSAAGQESIAGYFRQELQIQGAENPEQLANILDAVGVDDISQLDLEQLSQLDAQAQDELINEYLGGEIPEGVDPTGAGGAAGGPDPSGAGGATGGPDPSGAGSATGG